MHKADPFIRLAWKDQFNTPSPDQLRAALNEPHQPLFDTFRDQMQQRDGLKEYPAWHGDCWHWTLEYRKTASGDPIALLIPSPEDLQVAMPLDDDFASTLPFDRMKRTIRDGLELAMAPFHTRWAVWSLMPGSFIDDLVELVDRKIVFVNGSKG